MKLFKNLMHVIAVSFMIICLYSCGGGNQTTSKPQSGTNSYALGPNNQIYLNSQTDKWVQVSTNGLNQKSIYDLNCGSTICAIGSSNGLAVSNNFTDWATPQISNLNKANFTVTPALYSIIVNDPKKGINNTGVMVGAGAGGTIIVAPIPSVTSRTNINKLNLNLMVVATPTTNDLYEVIFNQPMNKNQYLAVGAGGVLLTSLDNAQTWQKLTTNTSNALYGITCDNVACIAIGDNGTILRSTDANIWVPMTSNITTSLYAITSNRNFNSSETYVATGKNVIIFSNDDGITWQTAKIPSTINGQTYSLYNVIYNGKEFISSIALADGTFVNQILYSEDNGVNWHVAIGNQVNSNSPTLQGSGGGIFSGLGSLFGGLFGGSSGQQTGSQIGGIVDSLVDIGKIIFTFL
jgi:hypothetical protein